MPKPKTRKRARRMVLILAIIGLAGIITILGIYAHVDLVGRLHIVPAAEAGGDCAVVLGAYVDSAGNVSLILRDRLDVALDLYNSGRVDKILVTGDHGREDYSEVWGMKDYLVGKGVPEEDIFMDHAGFNTYDSIYRAKAIFEVENPVVVTQEFHLVRALYIADRLGIRATGVTSDLRSYSDSTFLTIREMGARVKALLEAGLLKPNPKYLGDTIPISGNGILTEDRD